ncbi:MAG: patatin [Chitinophagaceae bacterium]|nr:MAG: patatin [Chitinophagaceae bacterium]
MTTPKFKVLSIDGGGIRGIIPCIILKYIEENTGSPISSLFNLIAGTSTGGIISVGLTKHEANYQNSFSAEQMLELYVKFGKDIFSNRPKDLLSWVSAKLFAKPYDAADMEALLNRYFGEARLKDALSNVLVTTYDIEKGKPFYFSSRLAANDPKENFKLKEIARSTSAAPTYFKPNLLKYDKETDLAFVDGGVFANNPSILAYSEAKELWKQALVANPALAEPDRGFDAVVTADDNDLPFYLLSLGTGFTSNAIKGEDVKNYRNKDWFEPLMTNVFMRSVAESTHYTMQHLLPPYKNGTRRYQRLDFQIPAAIAQMDDASEKNITALVQAAEKYVSDNKAQLDELCKRLVEN